MLGVGRIQCLREFSKIKRISFPKTGRGRTNTLTNRDAPRLGVCMERVFTMQHSMKFGLNNTSNDMILMLEALKFSKVRKLSSKKKRQLEILIQNHFQFISCEDPTLTSLNIIFLKVEIPVVFDRIKIHWQCKGDKTDELTQEALDSSAYTLWTKLSESLHNSSLPKIIFVPNKDHIWEEELTKILKTADYGINYIDKNKLPSDKS